MPDISMCLNTACKMSDTCYYIKAISHPYRQSYTNFEPDCNEENNYAMFVDVNEKGG
jgi:hypothetical protein